MGVFFPFFFLNLDSGVCFFFLGVACLDFNSGVSPGVVEKERRALESVSRQRFQLFGVHLRPSHLTLVSLKQRGAGLL